MARDGDSPCCCCGRWLPPSPLAICCPSAASCGSCQHRGTVAAQMDISTGLAQSRGDSSAWQDTDGEEGKAPGLLLLLGTRCASWDGQHRPRQLPAHRQRGSGPGGGSVSAPQLKGARVGTGPRVPVSSIAWPLAVGCVTEHPAAGGTAAAGR